MKFLSIVMVALLAGCVPADEPAKPSDGLAAEGQFSAGAASCQRAGGAMKPVGRMQTMQCVLTYADAGKSCTSGNQCAGDCRAASGIDIVPGRPIAGSCQATSDRFGCSTKVEIGRAEATICID
jgi:hypothetical protein